MKMNKLGALKATLDGHRVAHSSWSPHECMQYDDGAFRWYNNLRMVNVDKLPDDGEWVLWEPPKKKVKMWQWILRHDKHSRPRKTVEYYESEKDLTDYLDSDLLEIISKDFSSEIEVEVDG